MDWAGHTLDLAGCRHALGSVCMLLHSELCPAYPHYEDAQLMRNLTLICIGRRNRPLSHLWPCVGICTYAN
jgi:hypothetical protein